MSSAPSWASHAVIYLLTFNHCCILLLLLLPRTIPYLGTASFLLSLSDHTEEFNLPRQAKESQCGNDQSRLLRALCVFWERNYRRGEPSGHRAWRQG